MNQYIHFQNHQEFVFFFSQCSGSTGVCPDDRQGGRNDVFDVRGSKVNGITSVTYRRPLIAGL